MTMWPQRHIKIYRNISRSYHSKHHKDILWQSCILDPFPTTQPFTAVARASLGTLLHLTWQVLLLMLHASNAKSSAHHFWCGTSHLKNSSIQNLSNWYQMIPMIPALHPQHGPAFKEFHKHWMFKLRCTTRRHHCLHQWATIRDFEPPKLRVATYANISNKISHVSFRKISNPRIHIQWLVYHSLSIFRNSILFNGVSIFPYIPWKYSYIQWGIHIPWK